MAVHFQPHAGEKRVAWTLRFQCRTGWYVEYETWHPLSSLHVLMGWSAEAGCTVTHRAVVEQMMQSIGTVIVLASTVMLNWVPYQGLPHTAMLVPYQHLKAFDKAVVAAVHFLHQHFLATIVVTAL